MQSGQLGPPCFGSDSGVLRDARILPAVSGAFEPLVAAANLKPEGEGFSSEGRHTTKTHTADFMARNASGNQVCT